MTDLLIDADVYLYQAASACEVETDWGDDHWTLHSDAKEVRKVFDDTIAGFVDGLGGNPILCFSDPSRRSFRHDLCDTYKQARRKSRKPLAYAAIRDELVEGDKYKTLIKPRLEADDVMGIVSTRAPGKFIIVTIDKDLQCIPGLLALRGKEPVQISQEAADRFFLTQTLTGDATDGYSGCPGVGPVKAENILGSVSTLQYAWKAVVEAFKRAKLTEADALLQARLARILRATEWDFTTSEVKLWTPQ